MLLTIKIKIIFLRLGITPNGRKMQHFLERGRKQENRDSLTQRSYHARPIT